MTFNGRALKQKGTTGIVARSLLQMDARRPGWPRCAGRAVIVGGGDSGRAPAFSAAFAFWRFRFTAATLRSLRDLPPFAQMSACVGPLITASQ